MNNRLFVLLFITVIGTAFICLGEVTVDEGLLITLCTPQDCGKANPTDPNKINSEFVLENYGTFYKVTVRILAGPNTGDLRGVFLWWSGSATFTVSGAISVPAGATITPHMAPNLPANPNVNGCDPPNELPWKLLVEVGNNGIGMGDDYQEVSFILTPTSPGGLLTDLEIALRVNSVGPLGGDRGDSDKQRCKPRSPGGFGVGDPQFIGLRGQNYQVHGVAGEVYNIVSDPELQYNSRFVFLDHGKCPVINGRKQKGCWSHPGSYLGELGLKTKAGDQIHIVSGPADTGYKTIEVNGKEIAMEETMTLADNMGFISRNTTHLISLTVGKWNFDFENSDNFINQRVILSKDKKLRSHGLLGQTWKEKTYANSIKYIEGNVDDYVIRNNDIFGDDFHYNTFN